MYGRLHYFHELVHDFAARVSYNMGFSVGVVAIDLSHKSNGDWFLRAECDEVVSSKRGSEVENLYGIPRLFNLDKDFSFSCRYNNGRVEDVNYSGEFVDV